MPPKKRARPPAQDETTELKRRLEETEDTLNAIRQYLVDAFVVDHGDKAEVVTLTDAVVPYRTMVESMNEGAVTVIPDGTIFYCNPRFAEIVEKEAGQLVGTRIQELILPEEQETFELVLKKSGTGGGRREFCLRAGERRCVPVQFSVYELEAEGTRAISIIATDVSERVEAEHRIRTLASKLTIAEQEERHRISQILHDDLQQHLFAIKAQLALITDTEGGSELPESMKSSLEQIRTWLGETIAITRTLSIDLSPIVLHGEGLAEAVGWLAAQMKEQHGLDVDMQASYNFHGLDKNLRVLLFHAVRELLFNVVKHSGALNAVVTLEQSDGRGVITVRDPGRGFDAAQVLRNTKTSHGLLIIQDRIGLVGGKFNLSSRPGEGTQAVLEIPLGGISA